MHRVPHPGPALWGHGGSTVFSAYGQSLHRGCSDASAADGQFSYLTDSTHASARLVWCSGHPKNRLLVVTPIHRYRQTASRKTIRPLAGFASAFD